MKLETAIETTMAYQELKKLQPGETCTYDVLRAAMDMDPQSEGYGYVMTARRRIEREMDCVLEAEPNVGIKRLVPREVLNRGGKDIAHVRRSVRHGLRRQVTLVPVEQANGLSNEERTKFYAQLSYMGALKLATAPKVQKRIIQAAGSGQIPAGDVLRLAASPRVKRETPKAATLSVAGLAPTAKGEAH